MKDDARIRQEFEQYKADKAQEIQKLTADNLYLTDQNAKLLAIVQGVEAERAARMEEKKDPVEGTDSTDPAPPEDPAVKETADETTTPVTKGKKAGGKH